MRKGWKIFWIVCGAAAMIGLVCCAIAWGMGVTLDMLNNRFPYGIGLVRDDGDDGRTAKNIHESFKGTTEIDMELAAGDISFLIGEGDEVRVETKNLSEKLGFQCYQEGNELKLKSKKRITNINNIGKGTITVYIPKEVTFKEVSLDMGAGTLYIESIYTKDLSVAIGAGEVIIDEFQADEADFECGAGSITAKGDVRSSADLHCGVGSIVYTAAGREEEYNYDIECGIGEIICGDSTYSGLGKDRSIDNDADKDISIEGGIGSVVIDFDGQTGQNADTGTHHEEHE